MDALFEQPARDYLRIKANHRADTKRWNLSPFRPTQNCDFRHTEQLRNSSVDVRIVERRYVPNVASSAAVIRSASPATTITGRMLAFVSPSSLNVISRVQTEPADGWSRSTLPLVAPGSLRPLCQ